MADLSHMKSFRGEQWMLQCYWPALFTGPSVFGLRADTAIIFTRYHGGAWATGFCLLGFGLGVMHEPARSPGTQQEGQP